MLTLPVRRAGRRAPTCTSGQCASAKISSAPASPPPPAGPAAARAATSHAGAYPSAASWRASARAPAASPAASAARQRRSRTCSAACGSSSASACQRGLTRCMRHEVRPLHMHAPACALSQQPRGSARDTASSARAQTGTSPGRSAPPTTWHAAKLMARHTRRLRGAARLGAAPRQAQQRGELLDGGRVRIGAPAAVQRELQHVHAVRRLRPDPQGQGTHPDP